MASSPVVDRLIAELELKPLPGEGGFFRQTWRSGTGSAILFLLTSDNFSALHRLAQHEIWHFYAGDRVTHVQLDPRDRSARIARMGPDVLAGEQPQLPVPAGVWQGAKLADCENPAVIPVHATSESTPRFATGTRHGYALLGCTVSPPWDDSGFTLGARDELKRAFPAHAGWIEALTR
jgi:predicted cupin superfamily sugar epimerase